MTTDAIERCQVAIDALVRCKMNLLANNCCEADYHLRDAIEAIRYAQTHVPNIADDEEKREDARSLGDGGLSDGGFDFDTKTISCEVLTKAGEIQSRGCPFCGNPEYFFIVNSTVGIRFYCTDEKCQLKSHRISLEEAVGIALPKEIAVKKMRLYCVKNEIEKLEKRILDAEAGSDLSDIRQSLRNYRREMNDLQDALKGNGK